MNSNGLFFLEQISDLSKAQANALRLFYLPLVGIEAIILYEFLNDLANHKLKQVFSFQEIANHLQVDLERLQNALIRLEAVGLTKRYAKKQDGSALISMEAPLLADKFNKNALLKAHLVQIIGINEYENLYYGQIKKTISKTGYLDVSQKYQDVFPEFFHKQVYDENESFYSTMDLVVEGFATHEENIKKLPASHFIKCILKRNATFNENLLISNLLKLGFHDASINLLIDFSLRHNDNQLVANYILKIAQDFASRNIISFQDVIYELNAVDAIKNDKIKQKLDQHVIIKQEIQQLQQAQFQETILTDLPTIDEIFSDEDLEKLF